MLDATRYLVWATWGLVGTGVIAILFTAWQLAAFRKQSKLDNLERILEWFESTHFKELRRNLAEARLTVGGKLRHLDLDDPPTTAYEILDFFEHIGFLVKKHHLDDYDVWHSFSGWISAANCDFKELIAIEQVYDRTVYCDLPWLCKRLDRVDLKQGGGGLSFDDEDLERLYESEKNLNTFRITRRRRKSVKNTIKNSPTSPNEDSPRSAATQQSGNSKSRTHET